MNTAENQIPAKKPLPLPVGNSDWQHIAAYNYGFGEEALQFFRNFLSGAMKDGKHCRLGVITGILRVALAK